MDRALTIGSLAKEAGVNVETIRYYQRRGPGHEPAKPLGGHRHYASAVVSRVRFIKRAQRLGFSLEEIANLLRQEDGRSCQATRMLAEKKLAVIEERIAELGQMRRMLRRLVAQCTE